MNTLVSDPPYPVRFSVDYPDRALDRTSTAFRAVVAIPVLALLATVSGGAWDASSDSGGTVFAGAGGMLFLGPLLMIVIRRKYPRWWFDWNLELQRFSNRVTAYVALLDDRYPSTTDAQGVHLDYDYPDAADDLNRWLPLVKWLLAVPHYLVLAVLNISAVLAVVAAWFAIVVTGRYPKRLFDFVTGVLRWNNRVVGYAFTLVTDRYPPFRLS
ncbi:MAG: Putative transmembrane protein [uncultured Acidimicrobiales bacterium]|uniref:Transmembrane protein n=1 Tax=uncultured Acidimicrobiales bacterium TaxID=310071 RepID=A0A6J4I653_9ACTN|nr:MAG: Putative transmembrane protein [uncultured Acidimicrobiales bacterium]